MFIVIPPELAGVTLEEEGAVLQFPDKQGVYFPLVPGALSTTALTINGYTGFIGTKKLDRKYLPNEEIYLYEVEIDGVSRLVWDYLGENVLTQKELDEIVHSGITVRIGGSYLLYYNSLLIVGTGNFFGKVGYIKDTTVQYSYTAEYTP